MTIGLSFVSKMFLTDKGVDFNRPFRAKMEFDPYDMFSD